LAEAASTGSTRPDREIELTSDIAVHPELSRRRGTPGRDGRQGRLITDEQPPVEVVGCHSRASWPADLSGIARLERLRFAVNYFEIDGHDGISSVTGDGFLTVVLSEGAIPTLSSERMVTGQPWDNQPGISGIPNGCFGMEPHGQH
jgi:hypothetical protein